MCNKLVLLTYGAAAQYHVLLYVLIEIVFSIIALNQGFNHVNTFVITEKNSCLPKAFILFFVIVYNAYRRDKR